MIYIILKEDKSLLFLLVAFLLLFQIKNIKMSYWLAEGLIPGNLAAPVLK